MREPAERLKELTLREAYRTVIVRKRPDGVGDPALAIQEVLRSQVELAMNGNVRAQRDILNAVRAYERDDKQAETLEIYTEWLMQQGLDLETAIHEAKTLDQKIDFVAAARKVAEVLRLEWPPRRQTAESGTAESETGRSGMPQTEVPQTGTRAPENENCAPEEKAATGDRDAEPNAAAPPPSADGAPRAESGTATPPPASPPPTAAPRRPSRSRRVRHARRAREPAPATGAAGLLRDRRLHHRTGAPPFGVTWRELTSRRSDRQKLKNSLLNSLFSGNADARWAEPAPDAAPAAGRGQAWKRPPPRREFRVCLRRRGLAAP